MHQKQPMRGHSTRIRNRHIDKDQLLSINSKITGKCEKWIQYLLDDTKKTNLRLTGISEKSENSTCGTKNMLTEIIAEIF